jgi:predicted nucleic acid-binding protein
VILVDTSVWVDHLRKGRPALARLLEDGLVLGHPWVIGELALGHVSQRQEVIWLMKRLPQATVATDEEVLMLIDRQPLYGLGIGYVDAQLLAATQLTAGAAVWTADRRLAAAASRLGCAVDPQVGGAELPQT